MAGLFGGAKAAPTPAPAAVPPPPDRSSSDVQRSMEEQRLRFFGAGTGRSATSFTGASGGENTNAVVRFLGNVGR